MSATRGARLTSGSPGRPRGSGRSARCKPWLASTGLAPSYNGADVAETIRAPGALFHLSRPGRPSGTRRRTRTLMRPARRFPVPPFRTRFPDTMLNSLLTRVFGSRNERLLRQLQRSVAKINALEPEMQKLSDAATAGQDPRVPEAHRRRRIARQDPARSLRRLPRGVHARARHAPLRRAADRRHGAAPGQDRRDAHRRRQDPGRDAAGLPQRAGRQGRARRHRQRLPGAPRRGLDGHAVQLAGPDRRRGLPGHAAQRQARRLRAPTSPTAPTTNSASTTCATTWRCRRKTASSAACITRSSTKSTRS